MMKAYYLHCFARGFIFAFITTQNTSDFESARNCTKSRSSYP